MKAELLELLRDPRTMQPLVLGLPLEPTSFPPEVEFGILQSPTGSYPIVDGVPRMVLKDEFASGQAETVDSFSWKWRKATSYRQSGAEHYREWYLSRYGFRTTPGLAEFLLNKRMILDAGTAHGRDVEMFCKYSSATVVGVDIGAGVCEAYKNLWLLPRAHFVQADICHLPFVDKQFDFISCDQVIHHTPNTAEALGRLVSALAIGGHIAFYVYGKKGPVREFCDDHIRAQTVPMSPEQCWEVSEAITKLAKALHDAHAWVDVPCDIPQLGIKAGKQSIQRFVYWNMFKCYWNDTMDWDSNVATNFDWYHPLHAHRHTVAEVKDWCFAYGLEVEHMDVQESGISVLARRV